MRFLPGITTTRAGITGAREQLTDALLYGIRECGLFLTCLDTQQRHEFYKDLNRLSPGQISFPFVHARTDMSEEEYWLLVERHGAKTFNIHPTRLHPQGPVLSAELRSKILIENIPEDGGPIPSDLEGFAGVCLDLTHLTQLRHLDYQKFLKLSAILDDAWIGANHISAFDSLSTRKCYPVGHCHYVRSFDELRYLAEWPKHYFGEFSAIEVENPIQQQLEMIAFIQDLLEEAPKTVHIHERWQPKRANVRKAANSGD